MSATTGASTKELMSRGGWKSIAMVVRYEHVSDERDALLAQELNRYAEGANLVPLESSPQPDRARSAPDEGEAER